MADPRAEAIIKELGKHARFVRYYPALADLFRPYAEASAPVTVTSQKTGKEYRRYSSFDPICAAVLLVRAMELTGASTLDALRGGEWFEKRDQAFAEELGMGIYEFRAARTFLSSGGISLLDKRDLRNPVRTWYRAAFDRIRAFLSPHMAGFGQLALPLDLGPRGPGLENPNLRFGKSEPEVWKIQTSGCENPNPYSKDKEKEPQEESVGGAPARETHPAVLAFWEASGKRFWPQPGLVPLIIARVGDDPKRVELWKQINVARLARGELLMNVDRSLAYLDMGMAPEPAKVKPPGAPRAGRKSRGEKFRREQVPDSTEAEREAARERARGRIAARAVEDGREIGADRDALVARLERLRRDLAGAKTDQQRAYFAQYVQQIEEQLQHIGGTHE